MSIDYPRALLAALTLTVGVAIVVAASTSGAAFGLYNPAWDGTSALRSVADDAGAETTVARDTSTYAVGPANDSVAVVLAPETHYAADDAGRVRSFVESGGTLVVADDVSPRANALLSDVGADARLDGRRLRDEQHYYRGPALPVAGDVAAHEFTPGVDALTLNHGTAVEANGATPIVNTSGVAYLDGNGNDALDDDEPIGPFPVVTVEAVGDGRVVVVGDPSALVNVMLDRPGNRAFATALFSAHDRVLLDASHAGNLPPGAYALLAVRDLAWLQLLVGLVAVGAVALWARWPSIRDGRGRLAPVERVATRIQYRASTPQDRDEPGPGAEALAAHLRRRHPEWEPERIERVVDQVVRARSEESTGSAGRNRR